VDLLSFGGTKNGCIAADAVIFFDPAAARDFAFARQRAGHTFSKSWFVAAQFSAYLKDDHWLELASHANAMAKRLADSIQAASAARLAVKPAGNEVFAILDRDLDRKLRDSGGRYHEWAVTGFAEANRPKRGEVLVRLVASFETRTEDVDRFAALMR
jgi:threonine aldolase